ncbi:hypothetical protein [Streptomyces zaomyceticus]|uniref:hypothetical protein n=1 Tax=Streptomyces zaomyceticus TaxID=68286 RepID=UPI00343746E5
MAFYRDIDGGIWIDGRSRRGEPAPLHCVWDPRVEDDRDLSIGLDLARDEVRAQFGPLVEVRAVWEEV